MMIEFVSAEPRHLRELAENLRPDDLAEVSCFGLSPMKALWRSYRGSMYSRVALVDSRVAAVWGLAGTIVSDEASMWLLTSPEIERIKMTFIKKARVEMANMLSMYPKIIGQTDRNYTRALRLLEFLGFEIEDSANPILKFSMGR